MRALDPKGRCRLASPRAADALAPRGPSARLAPAAYPAPTLLPGMLIRLVTGCAWVDVEVLLGGQVSETTLRAPRDKGSPPGLRRPLRGSPYREICLVERGEPPWRRPSRARRHGAHRGLGVDAVAPPGWFLLGRLGVGPGAVSKDSGTYSSGSAVAGGLGGPTGLDDSSWSAGRLSTELTESLARSRIKPSASANSREAPPGRPGNFRQV